MAPTKAEKVTVLISTAATVETEEICITIVNDYYVAAEISRTYDAEEPSQETSEMAVDGKHTGQDGR